MSDKAQYGYLAGIVDGEGTITICRRNESFRNGEKFSVAFHVKVSVKNTDVRLMRWLKNRFGGEYKTYPSEKSNWKDSHVWHHAAESKQEFLLAILPYLIVKREQALVALDFLRIGSARNPSKRQELYEKIVALNQRGKPVETNTLDTSCKCGYPELHQTFVCPEVMRESVLSGDIESTPAVTQKV